MRGGPTLRLAVYVFEIVGLRSATDRALEHLSFARHESNSPKRPQWRGAASIRNGSEPNSPAEPTASAKSAWPGACFQPIADIDDGAAT